MRNIQIPKRSENRWFAESFFVKPKECEFIHLTYLPKDFHLTYLQNTSLRQICVI